MNQRLNAIADAAALLFLQQGYSKTQMSHIAKAVGVSVGAIYLDFCGKQEIMHFVLQRAIEPEFAQREFKRPISDGLFVGLEGRVAALLEQTQAGFAEHLADNAAGYSFEALISDAFDLLSRYALGCLFIEKNQFDFPFLAQRYRESRAQFLHTMAEYIRTFIRQGSVRPLEHLTLTTTLIVETLTWWAMDLRFTAFEPCDVPVSLAKEVCLDNIISAYRS